MDGLGDGEKGWDERVAMVTNGSQCSRSGREKEVADTGPKEK